MPSHLPAAVRRRLDPLRLMVLDVDGVLTDGGLFYTAEGEIGKVFSVRDGLAIALARRSGLQIGVISGRKSAAVATRCRELGVAEDMVILGSRDKSADLDLLEARAGVHDREVAAMGDDLPDLPMLRRVGFAACPADASPDVAAVCHFVCGADGGRGAVREAVELILKAQGRWQAQVSRWTDELSPNSSRSRADHESGR